MSEKKENEWRVDFAQKAAKNPNQKLVTKDLLIGAKPSKANSKEEK